MIKRGVFAGALLLAVLLAACKSDDDAAGTSGGVVVVVETDMAVPKDLDRVDLLVTRGGATIFQRQTDLGPGKTALPTTFEVRADRANGAPITIQAVGRQAGRARIVRDAITPVPALGLSAVHMALGWLCDNTAVESAPGQVRSTCPDGQTCVEGACSSPQVAPQDLTPYDPKAPPSPDKCFDAQTCFANAAELTIEAADCTVATPQGATKANLNLALKQIGKSDLCSGASCLAVLHSDGSGGWNPTGADLGARIKLPSSVCAAKTQGKSFVILASTSCNTKIATQAQCPIRPPTTTPSDVGTACTGAPQEACGNCGTHTRTCTGGTWSDWGACIAGGECVPGTSDVCGNNGTHSCGGTCTYGTCEGQKCVGPTAQPCGNCGTQTRTCSNGNFGPWGECKDQGECAPNAAESCAGGHRSCGGSCKWSTCEAYTCNGPSTQACGNCGTQRRACDSTTGQWGAFGACEQPTDNCSPTATRSCGYQGLQFCGGSCQYQTCMGQSCQGVSGDVNDGAFDSERCGNCGTRRRLCTNGQLGEWSECGSQGVCAVNTSQACGSSGTQTCTGTCAWGTCLGQTCAGVTQTIADGAAESGSCGNCGTRSRTCQNATFTEWGNCGSQGPCNGSSAPQACGSNGTQTCNAPTCQWNACVCTGAATQACGVCGTQTRTCTDGTWSAFGACTVDTGCAQPYREMAVWGLTPSFIYYGDTDTVVDQTTKLEWQRTVPATTYTRANAAAYCGGLVHDGHGVGPWRLPTKAELISIVEWTASNPAMYNPAFGNAAPTAPSADFWTNSAYVNFVGPPDYDIVNFAFGTTFVNDFANLESVRCVRDSELNRLQAPNYTVVNDMIQDNVTTRKWQRTMEDVIWNNGLASNYCAGKSFGGLSSGWRLPTIRELMSVLRPGFGNGYNSTDFVVPQVALDDGVTTWSSTPVVGTDGFWASAWDRPSPYSAAWGHHIRCVHD